MSLVSSINNNKKIKIQIPRRQAERKRREKMKWVVSPWPPPGTAHSLRAPPPHHPLTAPFPSIGSQLSPALRHQMGKEQGPVPLQEKPGSNTRCTQVRGECQTTKLRNSVGGVNKASCRVPSDQRSSPAPVTLPNRQHSKR